MSAPCSNRAAPDAWLPIGKQANSFSIGVNLTDGLAHEVSLYLVDFNNAGRSESVEVLNAETGAVLQPRKLCRISQEEST